MSTVPAVSIRAVFRAAIKLLPGAIRRRLAFAVALAIVLAVVEAAAIGGLFSVISVLVDDRAEQPGWSGLVFASNREQFTVSAASAVFFLLLLRSGLGFLAAKMQAHPHAETDLFLATRMFERALLYPYVAYLRRSTRLRSSPYSAGARPTSQPALSGSTAPFGQRRRG